MTNSQLKKIMILAENIKIAREHQRANDVCNKACQLLIDELSPQLISLMKEFCEERDTNKFLSSRAIVILGKDNSLTIK